MTESNSEIFPAEDQSLLQFFQSMTGLQLGTLSFNISGIAWIGLNLDIGRNFLPYYQPCAYLNPGPLTLMFVPLLFFAFVLALMAIRKGSLLPAFLAVTFVWSFAASILREFAL
jgi:hypothetical protein